jgi:hypothetical protein
MIFANPTEWPSDHFERCQCGKKPLMPPIPTSYPFLALSKVRNVPYCLVLAYADLCARPILYEDPNRPLTDQMLAAKARLDMQTKIIINDAVVNGVDRLAAQVPRIAP